jgi:hypothetical protein
VAAHGLFAALNGTNLEIIQAHGNRAPSSGVAPPRIRDAGSSVFVMHKANKCLDVALPPG